MSIDSASSPKQWWQIWRWALHWQIAVAVVVGVGTGVLLAQHAHSAAATADLVADRVALVTGAGYLGLHLIADLFMNGLRMLVVPLVTTAIISAVAGMGRQKGFARLGGKTLLFYLTTSAIAVVVGLVLVRWIAPGVSPNGAPLMTLGGADGAGATSTQIAFSAELADIHSKTDGKGLVSFLDVFRKLIPDNIIQAAVEGSMLGLIVFSLLVGFFTARLEGAPGETLRGFFNGAYAVMLSITELILRFAGPGVFALIACTVAEQWLAMAGNNRLGELTQAVAWFTVTVAGGLAIHSLIILPALLFFVGRVKPGRHMRAMAPALLTAFSSASSSATLPMTIECVEKRAGVSNRVGSFVLPLGSTVNMDGTALYECVAVLFIAQLYGIDLSFVQQLMVVMIALVTSIGVAGVPSASLVAIVVIMDTVGVPREGLAVIMIVDRLLDMCRTSVNVFSDSCGAVIIARTEGENPLSS